MASQVFLHICQGRTLWVPAHSAATGETRPVHLLNAVPPQELMRSFYLFDYPVQLFESPQMAALHFPYGKTTEDVINAVNEFRRVCAQDTSFVTKQCYNPNRPPPPQNSTPAFFPANPPVQTENANPLTQYLQVQKQQIPMMSSALLNTSFSGGTTSNVTPYSQGYYNASQNSTTIAPNAFVTPTVANTAGVPQRFVHSSQGVLTNYPTPQANMYSEDHNVNNYSMDKNFTPGPRAGHVNYPSMPLPNSRFPAKAGSHFAGEVRRDPEPINVDLNSIPSKILASYMNPNQKLVCASMPGARLTVWLRDYPIPERPPQDPAPKEGLVFCRKGIVLLPKATAADVGKSKPVELFAKQICMHFVLYGYCSRAQCFHEHHTEEQLRQLIAMRHTELMQLSKKERHALIDDILSRDKEGAARAEEERQERINQNKSQWQKHTVSAAGILSSETEPAQNHNDSSVVREYAAERSEAGSGKGLTMPTPPPPPATTVKAPPANTEASYVVPAPQPHRLINISNLGVTDSDDDKDGDGSSSNSSSSSSSSSYSSSSSAAPSSSPSRSSKSPQTAPAHPPEEVDDAAKDGERKRSREVSEPSLPEKRPKMEEEHEEAVEEVPLENANAEEDKEAEKEKEKEESEKEDEEEKPKPSRPAPKKAKGKQAKKPPAKKKKKK